MLFILGTTAHSSFTLAVWSNLTCLSPFSTSAPIFIHLFGSCRSCHVSRKAWTTWIILAIFVASRRTGRRLILLGPVSITTRHFTAGTSITRCRIGVMSWISSLSGPWIGLGSFQTCLLKTKYSLVHLLENTSHFVDRVMREFVYNLETFTSLYPTATLKAVEAHWLPPSASLRREAHRIVRIYPSQSGRRGEGGSIRKVQETRTVQPVPARNL